MIPDKTTYHDALWAFLRRDNNKGWTILSAPHDDLRPIMPHLSDSEFQTIVERAMTATDNDYLDVALPAVLIREVTHLIKLRSNGDDGRVRAELSVAARRSDLDNLRVCATNLQALELNLRWRLSSMEWSFYRCFNIHSVHHQRASHPNWVHAHVGAAYTGESAENAEYINHDIFEVAEAIAAPRERKRILSAPYSVCCGSIIDSKTTAACHGCGKSYGEESEQYESMPQVLPAQIRRYAIRAGILEEQMPGGTTVAP